MQTRKLEASQWQEYFDDVSKRLADARVTIEVAGLDVGDQIEVESTPLIGITYDPNDRALEIGTEHLTHFVRDPVEIWVEEDAAGLHAVQVVDREGHRQIVQLETPLGLGARPGEAQGEA